MDELHPLRGRDPLHVVSESLHARFLHLDHDHHVTLYPETWVMQVRWQHPVPGGLARFGLAPAAMTFEAETCWYTLHDMGDATFERPWQVRSGDDWVPMAPLHRQDAAA